jgi:hypothetical protein
MEFNAIKILDLNINRICPREGSLHFLFLNFFFQDFLKAFFTKKLHIILVQIPTVLTQKHINYISFFNTLISSPIEDLSNKKNQRSLGHLWPEIELNELAQFWPKRAILCAPTVHGCTLHNMYSCHIERDTPLSSPFNKAFLIFGNNVLHSLHHRNA